MTDLIPIYISNEEILVRFIFESDFKGKKVSKERVNFSNFMLPYKGGVSLQRHLYCDEDECKELAKKIEGKTYVGFFIFKKEDFDNIKNKYISNNRKGFQADLFSTPLDLDNNYLTFRIGDINFSPLEGNASHSDLIYINPSPTEDETPKTAMRSFVKKLFNFNKLIIDSNPSEINYLDIKFNKID